MYRYLRFINRNKVLPMHTSISSSTSTTSSKNTCIQDVLDTCITKNRISKQSTNLSRRRATLSPTSANEILQSVVHDVSCLKNNKLSTLANIAILTSLSDIVIEDSTNIVQSLESILNSPFVTSVSDTDLLDFDVISDVANPFPALFDQLDATKALNQEEEVVSKIPDPKIPTQYSAVSNCTHYTSIKNDLIEVSQHQVFNLDSIKDTAFKRYMFRMQQAELKYAWDIVSAEAAIYARGRKHQLGEISSP